MKSLSHNLFWFVKEKQEKFGEYVRDIYVFRCLFDFVRMLIHVTKIISILMRTERYTFTHDFIFFSVSFQMPRFPAY